MKKLSAVLLTGVFLCGIPGLASSFEGRCHFRDGHYYHEAGWWGFGGFVSGLAVGAYVASLPPRYETVYVAGAPYYYADGYYYQTGPSGYVVVAPPPTVVVQAKTSPFRREIMAWSISWGPYSAFCLSFASVW